MENENKFSTPGDVISFLVEKFPNCFFAKDSCKPLKIGIFADLAERVCNEENPGLSRTRVRQALRYYTSNITYLNSFVEGAKRVDLDGNEIEVITAEQIAYAQDLRKAAEEKIAARKKERELAAQNAEQKAGEKKLIRRRFNRDGADQKKFDNKNGEKKIYRQNRRDGEGNAKNGGKGRSFVKVVEKRSRTFSRGSEAPKVNSIESSSFERVDISTLSVGSKVHVLCGGSNAVEATVTELLKDKVGVELATGMTICVNADCVGK